jgi:transposase-like protein
MGAEMIGNSKAAGKKFKNYVADLSKTEQKQNKLVEKSVDELDNLDVNNPYDLLKFESYKANMLGANQKLKNIADEKIKLADLQSAINDTAEEYNLVADSLAKGKVKQAKKGASIKKAQDGTEKTFDAANDLDEAVVTAGRLPTLKQLRDFKLEKSNLPQVEYYTPEEKEKFDWMTFVNQVLPYVRPTDAEELDPRQLSGEMLALAQNQLEPVQAQTFQPQLSTPYDISLQDIINKNQADYRAAQRMIGYNPAALAALNAQKYQANQQVLGEQFRLNQAMRDKVYGENRAMLNQSNLQNLGIFDQQYGRQQQALSNTKATAQAALNSISAKYLQNQAENRTLQTYENLYNYRFDPRFRAMNMNALAQFAPQGSGMGGTSPYGSMTSDQMKIMTLQKELEEKQQKLAQDSKAKVSKNGALVKAIKSM